MFSAGMGPVADAAFSMIHDGDLHPTGVKIFTGSRRSGQHDPFHDGFRFAAGRSPSSRSGACRGHARVAAGRPAADRPATSSSAHALVMIGGSLFGIFAASILVAEDHRPSPRRSAGALNFWTMFRGIQRRLLPAALPRRARDAPGRTPTARTAGWTLVELRVDRGRLPERAEEVLREEGDVESREHRPEVQAPQPIVEETAVISPPVIEGREDPNSDRRSSRSACARRRSSCRSAAGRPAATRA